MSDRWKGLRRVFRLSLGRRAIQEEISEELCFHFEERIEELMAQGLSREAAEREVRTRFGDLPRIGAELARIDQRRVLRRSFGEALEAIARDTRFGIRMALGAIPGDLIRMVLGKGLGVAPVGLAAGLAGFLLLARLLSATLYGVSSRDPLTILTGIGILTLGAAVAAFVPARRAARVDPVDALREE